MKRIIVLGDSTMQFNDYTKYPQTGWPQALPLFTKENVEIINFAKNGRSTKSFIEEGRLLDALQVIADNDLVLICFGHNDYKDDPKRFSTIEQYQGNLLNMVNEVLKRNATPVLLTSIAERKFENGKVLDTHHGYPQAVKRLAMEKGIKCIDLNTLTKNHLEEFGEEKSKRYFMNFSEGDYFGIEPKEDDTHLRYDGAVMVARLFVSEMKRQKICEDWFRC